MGAGRSPGSSAARRCLLGALAVAALLTLPGVAIASRPPNTAIGGGYGAMSLGPIHTHGTSARVTFRCRGTRGASCFVIVQMTVREILRGKKVIAVAAISKRRHTRLLGVSGTTVSVPAGHSFAFRLPLYRSGKRLLARFHRLPVRLTLTTSKFKRVAATTIVFVS